MAAAQPFIEVWRGANGRWYGHRKAKNGRVTGTAGQGYASVGAVSKWAEKNYPGLEIRQIKPA
jgi:hypothetical protein